MPHSKTECLDRERTHVVTHAVTHVVLFNSTKARLISHSEKSRLNPLYKIGCCSLRSQQLVFSACFFVSHLPQPFPQPSPMRKRLRKRETKTILSLGEIWGRVTDLLVPLGSSPSRLPPCCFLRFFCTFGGTRLIGMWFLDEREEISQPKKEGSY